jgi:hypothetical protein
MTANFAITASLLFVSLGCKEASPKKTADTSFRPSAATTDYYRQIQDIPPPKGFSRKQHIENSFESYLRNLSLKKDKTVYLFDGRVKPNQQAQFAVIDMPVGNKDLQQCADAIMRLRAEYLFEQKRFDEIIFFDNDASRYTFKAPYTKKNFESYLIRVFGMCGSASLAKQLRSSTMNEVKAGDVFIRGGFPGHAVIVVDVVEKGNNKKFLLAQSYMPAQDIHVLNNPTSADGSPWYDADDATELVTPEYTFLKTELKKW